MRIIFFGASKYCLPVLEALRPYLKLVIVTTDKPAGRNQTLTPCATKVWAQQNGFPFQETAPPDGKFDLGVVADYGRILPEEEFNLPKLGTFNIHFSKLPDLRGASPVQQTILRGDATAWITVFKLERTLDTGPILDQREFPIFPDDTAELLYTRLFAEAAKYLPKLLQNYQLRISQGEKESDILIPQDHAKATYCQKLTKQDGFVSWEQLQNPALHPQIFTRYRAVTPWPGLWTIKEEKRVKILKCRLENHRLVLDKIQFEGKKPQSSPFQI